MQEVLDSALEQASAAARSRFFMLCKSAENSALSGERSATAGAAMGEATFIDSARESASDAVLRSGRVGDAVESLRAQLISTSARYSHRSPVTVFADARHLRNVAYQLAEHANRPGELADSGVFS